ncbi:anhydro-N-acetylmuramic acid kinase [Breoghania sp.]|uniref:anhydro-N-acetylmuramic acid kinase n=1 Tax=Breoghania sp. TaxID=2065378 RepID=UPI002AA88794|nr:anhydro-N-acetylmuramic acid kinase [Breoghania sp.]
MSQLVRALGMMSGTSMDGIDLAVIETDGKTVVRTGATSFRPYKDKERAAIRAALADARQVAGRSERTDAMREAEEVVTAAHAEIVRNFQSRCRESLLPLDVIGFHGQTVFHDPARRLTIQLGDADRLAAEIGVPVVTDLRIADVEAGGEGAPLVPVYHRAMAQSAGLEPPLAIVNIGGVANATWIGPDESDLIAFDTGPGNALIDDCVHRRTGADMDRGGSLAAKGAVDEDLVAGWLANPYFTRTPPKSLDRDAFTCKGADDLSLEDSCATLAAFTATSIAKGISLLEGGVKQIVVVGGGAHNPVLLSMLEHRCGVPVRTGDAIGWDSDFVEAQAFAYLAVRSLKGLAITFPGTTGVPGPLTGGRLARP